MTDIGLETIDREARRFRKAMEETDFSDTKTSLMHFPYECCHHACMLLGRFFFHQGLGAFQKMIGQHPRDPTLWHLWLRSRDGIIVDITGDQDDWGQPSVIVARHSAWHDALEGKVESETDDCYWQAIQGKSALYDELYQRVLRTLEELPDCAGTQ